MKVSLVLLLVAIIIFVVDWVAFALGYPLTISGNYFYFVYLAFFLAIVSVYLKLVELGQKRA